MNWTLLITIILTLANPFNIGLTCCNNIGTTQADFANIQVQKEEQPAKVVGTINTAGGTVFGPDGVSLTIDSGILDEPVQITIERVEKPELELPDYLSDLEIVSPYYYVSVSRFIYRKNGNPFAMDFPLPGGLSRADVVLVTYDQVNDVIYPSRDESYAWWIKLFSPEIIEGVYRWRTAELDEDGAVYVLLKLDEPYDPYQTITDEISTQQQGSIIDTTYKNQIGEVGTRVEGSLEPGGTFVGPGGVSIVAPSVLTTSGSGDTSESIGVFIEAIDDPTIEFPFPDDWPEELKEVVSPFYNIGTTESELVALYDNDMFKLTFPLPEGLTADDVIILFLEKESYVLTHASSDKLMWFNSFVNQPTILGNQVYTNTRALFSDGTIFTVVKKPASFR